MMRDQLRDKSYFENFITEKNQLIDSNERDLIGGKVVESKIERAKFRNFGFRLESLVAKYSKGDSIESLRDSIVEIIRRLPDEFDSVNTKVKNRVGNTTSYLDQYMVEPYERMLRLLSLAYLFDVSDSEFKTLVEIIDRDNISDRIYEFIIKARFSDRAHRKNEVYDQSKSVILKIYKNLREAIIQTDRSNAEKLVSIFLKNDFYHKYSGFFDFHRSKINAYYGYWSFEAAAVTCIMELNDSSYRGQQYYPKDLTDYYRKNHLLQS